MTSNQNLCQSPIIDSRFLKNDLENIFEFEEENGQKKSARYYCEQVVAAAGTKDLELSKDEWNEVKNIRDVLEKPNITTVALQAADLTPGMFMKEWCKLEKCLEENGEYVALGILSSMRKRKEKLLHNTHFLAGVYVDARYRILLNKSDKIKAREGLADIQLRLKRKKVFDSAKESKSVNVSQPTCDLNFISEDDDDDDDFQNELDRRENTRKISMKSHIEKDCEIQRHFEEDCKAIEDVGRIKVNVFEAIAHYPDRIRQSSRIAASMPTSQASVERLFSALKLILSDNRQSMKEDLLSAILFIRMND
ncbi:hypothetical protein HELRODRAFT_164299 [Helobdella robusta]|uniref:HAT C-terminal dimerisation domain-containing protein n=1 Tax=Helobdella robusta TaxID=6412 RepID=T1EV85_HELRO|nr:hypothetical protein HELRODRAFT_164299 [Helobdella robusta]ESN94453.1 hypothetical protein HELRODRAFT_164299 [Helobdella robusta]